MALEDKLRVAKAAGGLAAAVLPAFKRINLDEEVEYLVKHNPIIEEYVTRNPAYRNDLLEIAKTQYTKYRPYLIGGNMVDSLDRILSAGGMLADVAGISTGGLGNALSLGEEGVEMTFKLPYMLLYTRTGDYGAIPYWLALEAASTIPLVGDAIDMTNAYSNRAHRSFRKSIEEQFLSKVSNGKSRTSH
jgi:hypothetical protein